MVFATQGGKRPDGAKLIPWAKGKPLTWDVTVPDTFAASRINFTSADAGAATKYAATFRVETRRHRFYPSVYPVAMKQQVLIT